MDTDKMQSRIVELEREIATLPAGSITTKKIKKHVYYYHRITVNGNRKENYVDAERVPELKEQIEKRKLLEKELKKIKSSIPKQKPEKDIQNSDKFCTYIRLGDTLKKYASAVKRLKKRESFKKLEDFLYDENTEKVMILYGLRRTGKTTLIRQAICEMSAQDFSRSVFIQIKSSDTLADVNVDLKRLEIQGYKYIFIDEVTLMKDFSEGAALFSDIFAASGMKIVLSGTDSLGFLFSEDEQLFDRAIMLHTTFISYREFENVLGISGIDEYIRYGGTMSLSGVKYNDDYVFANTKRANEYVDSAIAKNIQHSLRYYQDGSHFRSLRALYDNRELTSAINRVVEDMNHRFTVETLTRTFRSHDFSVSAGNLRRDREHSNDILDRVNKENITERIKNALDILNIEEQNVSVDEIHAQEIKEYLKLLDLITDIEVINLPSTEKTDTISVIAQPGLRYVQAEALAESLLSDSVFNELDISEKSAVLDRIRNEIKGRMMEEIVLLETKTANPKKRVFKLQFAIGEFDMVVWDTVALTCKIYEIKHSAEVVAEQYRHLTDEQKCHETEHRFGRIEGKYVIYRGEPTEKNGITYLNVEQYLKSLS